MLTSENPNEFDDEISIRPETSRTIESLSREDSKIIGSKQSFPPTFVLSPNNFKRDPIVDSIVESRKLKIVENSYTLLAQTTTTQTRRLPPTAHSNLIKSSSNNEKENKNDLKDEKNSLSIDKQLSTTLLSQLDNERWEDGLNTDFDKESIASIDKSSLQVYNETCKRLNICPCSAIMRSLFTTRIDLQNYGLGAKGSAALAVALVRNTTVLSVNLSGNNIGNKGMSHIYQIMTENTYVEEYDLSFNNLGSKGIRKLAAAFQYCVHLKFLNVAGNDLAPDDAIFLLSKLEEHPNIKDLNISHNHLDEQGGIYLAKWLSDNNVLLNLNASWCSIRLSGARAVAKSIGDNNKLLNLDLSNNCFTNSTVDVLTDSLARNMMLINLDLSNNQIFCRYNSRIKQDPSIILIGQEASVYKMIVSAATNLPLKIFRLGKNHIDSNCVFIMLEALSKLEHITLEELDLTGTSLTRKQIFEVHRMFENHPKFTCYVEPVRQTVVNYANNLLNLIHTYCHANHCTLMDIFTPLEETNMFNPIITFEQFRDGLRKAQIPFPAAQLENIMKYLAKSEDEEGTISLKSIEIA